jgi:DNA polymerase III alpha subunit
LDEGNGDARAEALRREGFAAVPEADPGTLSTLDRADTIGCFQLESPATRSLLAQIPIRGVSDCVAALALVRPGAASGDAKQAFVRRAHGEEPPDYPHAALEGWLRETHGILLYEEDILRVLSVLGGISLEEADELRSAIQEDQDRPDELERLERRFLSLAQRQGIESGVARSAWEIVLKFAAYSFSKAHAWSYGLLGYRAAYMKTHFPVEFGCAVLNHHGGMYPPRTLAAAIGRWGVDLLPPSVNRSEPACTVEDPPGGGPGRRASGSPVAGRAVRIGLGKVKRLSGRSLSRILRSRRQNGAFRDLADVLGRIPLSIGEVEALVLSGACDELPPLSPAAYPFAHEAAMASLRRGLPAGAVDVLAQRLAGPRRKADPRTLETYRSLVRIQNELRFLEMHVSDHPMRVLRREAERHGCLTTREAARCTGEFVRLAAIVAATRRVATKDGSVMRFVTLEDEEGTLEAVIFPGGYRTLGDAITTPGPFLLAGTVEDDHGDVHVVVSEFRPFHQRTARRPGPTGCP